MITSSVGGASLRDSVVTFTSIQARPSSRFTAKFAETSWCHLSNGASKTMTGVAFATPRKAPTTNAPIASVFLNDFTVSISVEIDFGPNGLQRPKHFACHRSPECVSRIFTVSVDATCREKERLGVLEAYSLGQSRDGRAVTVLAFQSPVSR